MSKPSFVRTSILVLGCLALCCIPGFAQHGGGGHAGGGGGARGGGGGGFRGSGGFSGGGRASAPAVSGGGYTGNFYRQAPSTAGGNRAYSNPYRGGNAPSYGRAYGSYGRGAQPNSAYRPAPGTANAYRDGQWHSFGNAGNGSNSASVRPSTDAGQTNGNWQSFAGPTRSGVSAGARPAGDAPIRSFAGQGNNIRETTPVTVAANAGAAANRGRLGFTGSMLGSTRLGGSPAIFNANGAGNTMAARSAFAGAGFNSGFGARVGAFGGFGFNRFGFGRFGFDRFGFGLRPFGLGWWWPYWGGLGYWNPCGSWGPGWFNAGYGFGFGDDPFDYGYAPCAGLWGAGYGPSNVGAYPYPGPYYYPDDQQYPEDQGPPLPEYQGPPPADQNNPQNEGYPQEQNNSGGQGEVYNAPANNGPDVNEPTEAQRNMMAPVQLYLKDGGVFGATIYWIANNRLNYVTDNGAVITMDIDQLDLQRTISENAKRGVPFTLSVQGNNVAPPVPANAPQ